ncbi:MAG: glycogen-binding domain-containing protein, partial [Candidatus Zixiibacteriota bacterium]
AGTFNNWEPQAMAQKPDGRWSLALPLAAGTYEYQFLVDTEWRPDPNNPGKRSNRYGGFNSICEVM